MLCHCMSQVHVSMTYIYFRPWLCPWSRRPRCEQTVILWSQWDFALSAKLIYKAETPAHQSLTSHACVRKARATRRRPRKYADSKAQTSSFASKLLLWLNYCLLNEEAEQVASALFGH